MIAALHTRAGAHITDIIVRGPEPPDVIDFRGGLYVRFGEPETGTFGSTIATYRKATLERRARVPARRLSAA